MKIFLNIKANEDFLDITIEDECLIKGDPYKMQSLPIII